MSRCFPFPPPGYAGKCSRSNNEALIVSIKLQREMENGISDREQQKVNLFENKEVRGVEKKISSSDKKDKKDKKKEKKEKKELKEKHKARSAVDSGKQKSIDQLYRANGCSDNAKTSQILSKEVLEQSVLTEEHGRAVESQNASCSSDSTGNSGKRKRHSSPPSSIQGSGNIIRIRLSSQKKDDPSTSGSVPIVKSEEQYTLQSKVPNIPRTECISQNNETICADSTSTATLQLVSRKDKELRTLQEREAVSLTLREDPTTSGKPETTEPKKKLSSHERKILKRESLYNDLFQNLVPSMLHSELMVDQDDDEDWLFGKNDEERPAKRLRSSDDVQASLDSLPCSASAAVLLQPRAQYLSDVGLYALPFTVPF